MSHRLPEEAPSSRTRRKLWVLKFSLLFGSLVTCCLVLEVGLRVTGAKPVTATALTSYFGYSRTLGWVGQPNAAGRFTTTNFDAQISHDNDGLRHCGLETSIANDANDLGTVTWCLGDSGTWGWGVDDGKTYVDLLNQRTGSRHHFRNLGMCGYSSLQQYLLLKDLFQQGHRPSRVMILFCSNDLAENLDAQEQDPPRAYLAVEDGEATIHNLPVPQRFGWNVRSWLKRNSLAYNYVHFYFRAAKNVIPRSNRREKGTLLRTSFDKRQYKPITPAQRIAIRETYSRIATLCQSNEVDCSIAIEVPHYRDMLIEVTSGLPIRVLDLSPPWIRHFASDDPPATCFPTDPHYNELGHSLLADGIKAALGKQPLRTADRDDSIGR